MEQEESFEEFALLLSKSCPSSTHQHYHTNLDDTRVLLINLNTTMTELAKSLIYKGVNLYLYDKDKKGANTRISKEDVNNNYYISKEDIGKERIKIVFEKLALISISVSISILDDLSNLNNVKGIAMACVGFSSFDSMIYFEEYFTRRNIVYYCINSSGIYGFYYNNMINTKKVKRENKYMKRVHSKYLMSFNTVESLEDIMTTQKSENGSTVTSARGRNRSLSPKPKAMTIMKENTRKSNELYFAEYIKINPIGFNKKAEDYLKKVKESCDNKTTGNNGNNNKTNASHLQLIIYLMEMYYRKNVDISDLKRESKENNFQKKVFYIENFLKRNHMKTIITNQSFQQLLKKFVINYNQEFTPISSMLAEIVSKEIFNFIVGAIPPRTNLITYDSGNERFDYHSFLSV